MNSKKLIEIRAIASKLRYSENGMNQERMAKQIGISASYLSLVLHGKRPITAIIYDYFVERKNK